MKIGIISDIHADLTNLQKALTLLQQHSVDQIICAGDLVDGGPDGDAVVQLIQAQHIPCVQGNHDREAFADQAWLRKINPDPQDPSLRHIYLHNETVGFLAKLPLLRRLQVDEVNILLAHGTPWSNTTYVFPDARSNQWDELTQEADADIIVLGHTHVPMCRQWHKTWIVNPGSVYENRWNPHRHTCAILEPNPFHFAVYDIDHGQVLAPDALNCVPNRK